MHSSVKEALGLLRAASRVVSQVEERPWGLLFFNEANPDHYFANIARSIHTAVPQAVIAEIIHFYRSRGLRPRVEIDDLTQPSDLATYFEDAGFTCTPSITRVMHWDRPGEKLRMHTAVTVRRATLADSVAIATIGAEGTLDHNAMWLVRKLPHQFAHPAIRYYVALADQQLAACACVFQGPHSAWIDDVATLPAFRGRGLATALIARIQADASSPLLLEVAAENAARIYQRAGFQDCGELRTTMCWLPPAAQPV